MSTFVFVSAILYSSIKTCLLDFRGNFIYNIYIFVEFISHSLKAVTKTKVCAHVYVCNDIVYMEHLIFLFQYETV